MPPRCWIRAFGLAAALGLLTACHEPAPVAQRNLLLLTVDTLRADHLGCYGYPRDTSPAIDRFARQGVLFEAPIVQRGGTWPSLTSILTSLHPRSHGVRQNGEQLDASKRILAEFLRDEGFATAAFATNMRTAPNRGFETKPHITKGARDEKATRLAIAWLERHAEQRFFLWVHLMEPHDPYAPPKYYRDKFDTGYRGPLNGNRAVLQHIYEKRLPLNDAQLAHLVSLYDGDVAKVDEWVGQLLDTLDRLDLSRRTLVVFASDHGEELYEHNRYFFHSYSIYESVLRVPLIMRLPDVLPAGARVPGPVESVDIAPTALELLGVPTPESFEGVSLLPRIRGEPAEDAAAISELGPHIFSIRTERWHYLYNPQELTSPNTPHPGREQQRLFDIAREELYDVERDPQETRNLVAERPDVVARLRGRLEAWLARGDDGYTPQQLSPQVEEELRALGYID